MNKMLYALRRLQGESTAEEPRPVSARETKTREAPPRVAAKPRPAFDVSAWSMPEIGPEFDRPSARAIPAEPSLPKTPPPPTPAPIAAQPPSPSLVRAEAPWERAARSDLASANGAAFREIQTQLRRDLPSTAPRAVFLAGVGCLPEDTAAVALRLGLLNAAENLPTLLIDGEADRWLTDNLLAGRHPGLLETLSENVPAKHFLIPTGSSGLSLLPYGAGTAAIEAASAPSFAATIDDLKTRANLILVAGGGGETPLAAALARACDGCYLLVRLGVATSQQALAVRESLVSAGARLLGCIALAGDSPVGSA